MTHLGTYIRGETNNILFPFDVYTSANPYTLQEELNIKTDKLAERAQTELPDELRPRHDALHFPEKQISVPVKNLL
jgi:hypothetical protein